MTVTFSSTYISRDKPWLAPLAGYSDLPFRLLCRELGAGVCVTEMVSAKGLIFGTNATARLVATTSADTPLVVQIFGAEPEYIGLGMDYLLEHGFTYFDLNAGCPVPKVAKSGSGAVMLKTPETLYKVAETMVERAGTGNVGIKFRLGWDTQNINCLEIGQELERLGAGWLSLHPRTARQGYSGTADWSYIRRLVEAVDIPVIASGDLHTAEDGIRCLDETGAAAIMFARGALSDPAIFAKFNALINSRPIAPTTGADIASLARRQADLIREQCGDAMRTLYRMRSIIPRYVKSLPGARSIRKRITACVEWEELQRIIADIEQTDCPTSKNCAFRDDETSPAATGEM
ncbi:MAG: tRNA dihydrouridine synthase [Desulfovibrio sp.]|uniref:tRNA dihydrouridine synthase n=1 Tax=Desulfovibrio sp. 7SRBS1 TaxID=3378064 RepID=UPI003B3F5F05